jgi:hypothetical protein
MKKIFTVVCIFTLVIAYSCTHVSGTFISEHGSMRSGSMKDNCMDCHKIGATEGGFTVGGTVFEADSVTRYPNGTVYLYSGPNESDSVVATIEVDGVGNFYTTHPIDMSKGLYPAVVSSRGYKAFMQTPTSSGACNSCHGVSQAHIVVK